MRKITLYMFTTLDGFIAGPNGEFDAFNPSEEVIAFGNEFFGAMDGMMFGRTIYEGFVEYWDTLDLIDSSNSIANVKFALIFRNMTRVVFSRTLDKVGDKTILIKDNIAAEVAKLKQQPGRDFVLVCGPELLATFVDLNLVDEYRILVLPTVLGRGKALFGDIKENLNLKLLSTRVFESGVVMHHYRKGG
jgi:dihydrofolate reductase